MKLGPRDGVVLALLLALSGIAALAISSELDEQLRQVRRSRVKLEARRALADGTRPVPGDSAFELTLVEEKQSAKYPFLNKRRYLVNTGTTSREGSALLGGDEDDKARGDRHAEARRKGTLDEELPGGSRVRATVADGLRSAELTLDPPPIERGSPLSAVALSVLLGLASYGALRIRVVPAAAGPVALLVATAAMVASGDRLYLEASVAATAYLARAVPSAPVVNLPVTAARVTVVVLGVLFAIASAVVLSERGARLGRAMLKSREAYAAIAPAMTGLAVLVGLPFAYGIGLSFFEHVHGRFTFVGLQNFARILSPPDRPLFAPGSLLYALFVNVAWTVSNVTLHAGIGLMLALLLQGRAAHFSKLYRVFLIIPWAVPAYLTALIWKSMFDPDVGAINRLLGMQGTSWMHDPVTAFAANLATNVWLGFPFMMVVCLGALTSIPKDLYEAADVDGASATAQFFRITLPLLQPALLPAVILGSIWTFNRFEIIYLVSEGRPDGATDILVTEAYRWAFERGLAQGGAYGYAAAYSVVIFVVLLVYGWMTSRVAKAAEEALR